MDRISFYTETAEDGLSRKVWVFVLIRNVLYLDKYRKEIRQTRRHKNWESEEYYMRLGRDRDYRGHGKRVDSSVLTDVIKRVALNEFMASLKVDVWPNA